LRTDHVSRSPFCNKLVSLSLLQPILSVVFKKIGVG